MPAWLKTIRAKLTLWYAFVLLITLAAVGLVAYIYSSQQLAENLDRSLANEVRWVNDFITPKAAKVKPSKKFSPKKKTAPVPEIAAPMQDQPDVGDADDEIWTQIYQHALLNPKKT